MVAFIIKMAEVIVNRCAKLAMLLIFVYLMKSVGYGNHRKNMECPDGIPFT